MVSPTSILIVDGHNATIGCTGLQHIVNIGIDCAVLPYYAAY